jgi:hypothetical protein
MHQVRRKMMIHKTVLMRRGAYKVLVEIPEGKRPLGRPRVWMEEYYSDESSGSWLRGMDWIDLAEDWDR